MSGICGIFDFGGAPIDPKALRSMATAAAYRGPDGQSEWLQESAGLIHLALHTTPESIMESQPLVSSDGQICLVSDARLDNRNELMRVLSEELRSAQPGDGELILAAYLRWQDKCPEYLLGDFAFVIWDSRKMKLLCSRDPLGMKRLHYSWIGKSFLVATEAQQILAHPGTTWDLDSIYLGHFLCGALMEPQRTPFKTVKTLLPAHTLTINQIGMRIDRYWDIDPEIQIRFRNERDYATRFQELIARSVEDRLRSTGEKIGISLSGGLDSGSVAALAQRGMLERQGRSPEKLLACSYIYSSLEECDERIWIRDLAKKVGVEIVEIEAEQFDFFGSFQQGPFLESPVHSRGTALDEMMGQLQEMGVRVMLTGHGGDEMATGSRYSFADRLKRGDLSALIDITRQSRHCDDRSVLRSLYHYALRPFLPAILDSCICRLLGRYSSVGEHSHNIDIPSWLSPEILSQMSIADRRYCKRRDRRFGGKSTQLTYEMLVELNSYDAAVFWYESSSAHHEIEVRHPFLDRRIAEYVLAIPPSQLFKIGCTKPLLRRAMKGWLPESILLRKEITTSKSMVDATLQLWRAVEIEDIVNSSLLAELGLVDISCLASSYRAYQDHGGPERWNLMYFVILELWLRNFFFEKNRRGKTFSGT